MDYSMNRRQFISNMLKTGVSVSLASTLLQLSACTSFSNQRVITSLLKDPNGICDLPAGFRYTIISKQGERMSDGLEVPDYHDGMGCFQGPNGELILVRNHEMPLYFPSDPESPVPAMAYDPAASGGTTTIWLDQQLNVTRHFLSLTGTIRNCGGGVTPWGTWISCEEAGMDGWFMGDRHGYCYEVNPRQALQRIQPLKAMGRFNHEAIAIDPISGIVYLTEDDNAGCFYRFLPHERTQLQKGGVLQALKFTDNSITHTSKQILQAHTPYACEWVNIDEPDPEENTVYAQAQAKGAAIFVRGEGIVAHEDGIYFACTSGGAKGLGQFFRYIPDATKLGGTIALVYEAVENGVLEKPDNITINAWGDLIICEDNSLDKKCLVGLTPSGKHYYIAANAQSEWAGACFSPNKEILFANIHKKPGMTVAIQGPWEKLRASAR